MNNRYRYGNFVRPSSAIESSNSISLPSLTGEEAKRIYLEEIKEADNYNHFKSDNRCENRTCSSDLNTTNNSQFSKNDLFLCVQNNDTVTLNLILEACPSLISITDEYGWSLLMIACQANSVDIVKELLKRGVDISVRDKGGNSARSLVINNRNLVLADILLTYQSSKLGKSIKTGGQFRKPELKRKEIYMCEICNKEFRDKEEHLSSTVHNMSASKGKKIPTKYEIPESNKGYQLMLKVGWDKESGLGPDGSGKKYPIKTVQKPDRKGLGLDKRKRKPEERKEPVKNVNRQMLDREYKNSKSMEINFRRLFY